MMTNRPEIEETKHNRKCYHIDRVQDGLLNCISEFNLCKKIQPRQKSFIFREKEIYAILERLLTKEEKILFINGPIGIGKSSIVKQVQWFFNDRKLCTAGNIHIECKNIPSYYQLIKTIQRQLMNLM